MGMAFESVRIIIEVSGEDPLEVDLDPGIYVLGREESCELFIENDGISRRHARLSVVEDRLTVEDLGSSNGSFLNGEPIADTVVLTVDSVLVLGTNAITIRMDGAGREGSAASQMAGSMASADLGAKPPATGEINIFDANYALRDEIARGGMGAVIEADDQNTGRTVAIKKMLMEGNPSEESKHRFLQEARVMGHLEHPNIVPMHELALDEQGMPYYTMKRIQGTDLQDVLTRIKNGDEETVSAYPLRTLLGIFLKVCDAMAFAHSKGVIHRDLKPENIMLGEFGEVLVADWGLAKILPETPLAFLHMAVEEGTEISEDEVSEEGSFKTMEGSVMGTPNYMAPEQAEGKTAEIDRLSDIFSLGGILYSILTLRPPVLGKTVSEVLENMRAGYIAPPVLYNKVKSAKLIGRGKRAEEEVHLHHCPNQQIPDSLSRVAMHAMNLERKERYQKVQEFQKDIEAWQLGYATTAEEADFWRQIVLFVSRNKAATITGCLVALIGTTMIVWSLFAAQKAQSAMTEMQTAVPLIEGELQASIDTGQFDRAMGRLNSLIMLLPDNAEYRFQRAQIHQSLFQFEKAATDFETVGELEGDAEKYVDAVTFSRELAGASGTNGLDNKNFELFVNRLDREQRFAEARFHRRNKMREVHDQLSTLAPEMLRLIDEKSGILRAAADKLATAENGPATTTAEPAPDAHWDFEIDGRDRIGNLHLKPNPQATVTDGSLRFDGDNGHAGSEVIPESIGEFSIEIWTELELNDTRGLKLFRLGTRDSHRALSYNGNGSGKWDFQWRRNRRQQAVRTLPPPSGLSQYVLTVGPDAIHVYFNGTNSMFRDGSARIQNSFLRFDEGTAHIRLGHYNFNHPGTLKGRIAEARFFHRVLSSDEIIRLHRSNPLAYQAADLMAQLDSSARQRLASIATEFEEATAQMKALNRLAGAETSDAMLRSYQQLLKENGAPQDAIERLKLNREGALTLELPNRNLEQVTWLKGIPLSRLDFRGSPLSDLTPLRGMPLKHMALGQTKISRLDPLAGMQLDYLVLANTLVGDIGPLRGMPLRSINLGATKVSDLSALKGAPLENLEIYHTAITSLEPLRGMQLKSLVTGASKGITNLAPLKGQPLTSLKIWDHPGLNDLSPLAGMKLGHLQAAGITASNWEILRDMPLRNLDVPGSNIRDLSVIAGKQLKQLILSGTKATDFDVLRNMDLHVCALEGTAIRDLSQIGGTNLSHLNLQATPITDLSPLAGRRIKELWLRNCKGIKDVRPLLQANIQWLVVPPNADNLEVLRDHPTISRIAWGIRSYGFWEKTRWDNVPTKEEFWQAWDGGKRSP